MTSILEKLWKKFYHIAILRSKDNPPYQIIIEYQTIFNMFDELKLEVRKSTDLIRKNLFHSRPMILSRDQLEDYLKRIAFANEIISCLNNLVNKTFDTYIKFIDIYWETSGNLEVTEQQRMLSERYDMSLTEWQFILSKIERFNEVVKKST